MKNKGFSLVELIIVVAIMAILAGALAPFLIKYINKARISNDIDTGATIGRALVAAVSNEHVFFDAVEHPDQPWNVNDMDGDEFKEEVFSSFGVDVFEGKSSKDVDGNELDDKYFYYTLDSSKNKVVIYYGGTDESNMIYPDVGAKFKQ